MTQQLPLPVRGGADLRAVSTIEALAACGPVAVWGVYPQPPMPPPRDGIAVWTSSSDRRLSDQRAQARASLEWLRTPDGHPSDRWFSELAARELTAVADEFRPDVVVLDHLWQQRYLDHVQAPGRMVVLHAHNVEGALHHDIAAGTGNGRSSGGSLPRVMAQRAQRLEAATVRAVDQVWVPSERDAGLMADLYGDGLEVRVVPSGVDPTRYRASDVQREPALMVYPARFDYPPNRAAARRLSHAVLPALRREFAGARLELVGVGATACDLEAAEAVEAVGPVPDVAPFLQRASVMPVALDSGGGTRLKVLEAFAAGVPVVSTRKGVEGLEVNDGEHVILADSDSELVAGVSRVWRDGGLRAGLVERGAALVRSRYGPPAVERAVADALGRVPA